MTSMAEGRGLLRVKLFDEGEAEDDAEDAVEGAGVGDCVEMRGDDEAWGFGCCGGVEAADVADGVDRGRTFRRTASNCAPECEPRALRGRERCVWFRRGFRCRRRVGGSGR